MGTIAWPTHQAVREMRYGVALGPRTDGDLMPRPEEGQHVLLSLSCRPSGDRWVLMIKDQTGPGRHRRQP